VLGGPPVADDEGRAVAGAARVIAGQPFDGEPMRGRARHDVGLALAGGQPEHRVQAGRNPGDLHARRVTEHGRGQPVAAPAVGEPGVPDLAVVAA